MYAGALSDGLGVAGAVATTGGSVSVSGEPKRLLASSVAYAKSVSPAASAANAPLVRRYAASGSVIAPVDCSSAMRPLSFAMKSAEGSIGGRLRTINKPRRTARS